MDRGYSPVESWAHCGIRLLVQAHSDRVSTIPIGYVFCDNQLLIAEYPQLPAFVSAWWGFSYDVERTGIEPATPCLQSRLGRYPNSTSC
jgi:hypothetical protein